MINAKQYWHLCLAENKKAEERTYAQVGGDAGKEIDQEHSSHKVQ